MTMIHTITFIGTLGGVPKYTEQDVLNLLHQQKTELSYGNTFTGRPSTLIYQGDQTIVKIHSELRLEPLLAKRWGAQTLEKEKHYQVYHPDKTWFVLETSTQTHALIGNICPRLRPLHDLFTDLECSVHVDYLNHLFNHYFRLASEMNIRLDECLSNFGIDVDQQLYYLDDDTYSWDRFVTCAQMLGVYFRSQTWLNEDNTTQLGQVFHHLILKYFKDSQYLIVLAEQFKDAYLPTATQQHLRSVFIAQLNNHATLPQPNLSQHRYLAILADIHANLPALKVVLDFLALKNITQGIVLGDIVGYGPHPSQCIEYIQNCNFLVIKGNHDHALATNNFNKGFSTTAKWVLQWSQERISISQKHWLAHLPPLFYTEEWLALHGAPIDPTFFNAYVYEMTYRDNLEVLQRKNISLCFHGHSHHPGIYGRRGPQQDEYIFHPQVHLNSYLHTLVCPGSIGQPRGGKAGAQFAIYDQKERKVYFYTLRYPLEGLITEMDTQGFPDTLINLLKEGT